MSTAPNICRRDWLQAERDVLALLDGVLPDRGCPSRTDAKGELARWAGVERWDEVSKWTLWRWKVQLEQRDHDERMSWLIRRIGESNE